MAETQDTPPLCAHCGRAEDEHHTFEPPRELPAGCKCEADSWATVAEGGPLELAPACATYVHDAETGQCGTCEHDEACHAKSEAA